MAAIVASSNGDNTIVVALAGKKIRVFNYLLSASAAVNAKWKSGAATDLTGLLYLGVTGGAVCPDSNRGWFDTAAGEALVLNLSGAVPVGGHFKWAYVNA